MSARNLFTNLKSEVEKTMSRMNHQITNTDEKRAVERWENEGGG